MLETQQEYYSTFYVHKSLSLNYRRLQGDLEKTVVDEILQSWLSKYPKAFQAPR